MMKSIPQEFHRSKKKIDNRFETNPIKSNELKAQFSIFAKLGKFLLNISSVKLSLQFTTRNIFSAAKHATGIQLWT